MDDKEIKIDLNWLDNMLNRTNGTQLDFFDDLVDKQNLNYANSIGAATISTAASSNLYPYISMGSNTYTLSNSVGTGGFNINTDWNFNNLSPGLSVRGDAEFDGDVKIQGKSIVETLDKIEQRLAILRPNKELEDKWEKLKELGDAYRALEKDIQEKEKIWETLKK